MTVKFVFVLNLHQQSMNPKTITGRSHSAALRKDQPGENYEYMKTSILICVLLILTNCTPKCKDTYTFESMFTIPAGSGVNRYYFVANCESDYWDTSKILKFIMLNDELQMNKTEIKYVGFYNSKVFSISRNEADLDEVEIEKELIVRYYFDRNTWSIGNIGKLNE
jgi:hypothetical protein